MGFGRFNTDDTIEKVLTEKDYEVAENSSEDLKPFDKVSVNVFEAISKLSKEKPDKFMTNINAITELYGSYSYAYKQLKKLETALLIVSEKGICNSTESKYYKKYCESEGLCKEEGPVEE